MLTCPTHLELSFGISSLARRNRSDFCDLRLRCPSRTPEIARFPKQEKAMPHCDLRVRWKVASDLRFRAAISEPKTGSSLSFLSLFFGKRQGKPPKKQGFFIPTEPLKSLEKKGKTLKKTRNSSQGEKKQGIPNKKQGKEGQGFCGISGDFFWLSQRGNR